MKLWLAIVLNLICSTFSDVLAKYWGQTSDTRLFWIGMIINIGTTAFFMWSIRLGGLAITTAFLLLATVMLNAGIGVWLFREAITFHQALGLVLAVLALGLLVRP
jgi:multidrug transporter EmrE-like cation transporter